MYTLTRIPTTEMEVTSIRLERDLKERLKELAGDQGYQALIRDILWNHVRQAQSVHPPQCTLDDIRARVPATATQEEFCALTGQRISPQEAMYLGLTKTGTMVPLSIVSLA